MTTEKSNMDYITFTGWIEKIYPADNYKQKFVVTNFKNEEMRKALVENKVFANTLEFTASVKTGANAQLDGVNVGDKVQVRWLVQGRSGIAKSTGKYYCINTLNISKDAGLTVIERVSTKKPDNYDPSVEDEDVPF